jgi:hypothetical protein
MPSCTISALEMNMDSRLHLAETIERAVSHGLNLSQADPEPGAGSSASGTFLLGEWDEAKLLDAGGSYEAREAERLQRRARSVQMLAWNLGELDCPQDLIQECHRVAADLRRQSAVLQGGAPSAASTPRPQDFSFKDLYGFALELSTDCCVVETFEATRVLYQARSAADPELRTTLAVIAQQQMDHAVFYWELLDWALSQLSPSRARNIRAEQRRAREDLRVTFCQPMSTFDYAVGKPSELVAHGLLDALEFQLFGDEVAA